MTVSEFLRECERMVNQELALFNPQMLAADEDSVGRHWRLAGRELKIFAQPKSDGRIRVSWQLVHDREQNPLGKYTSVAEDQLGTTIPKLRQVLVDWKGILALHGEN